MARGNEDADSGSSQFFLLKWDQVLNPVSRIYLTVFLYFSLPFRLFPLFSISSWICSHSNHLK
jgi:hypothetical protein